MANDLRGRPWILDTASNTPVQQDATNPLNFYSNQVGAGAEQVHTCFCHGFVFRDYTNSTDTAQITDGIRGIVIAELVGNAAKTPVGEAWYTEQPIKNLTLSRLDSGKVEVILK